MNNPIEGAASLGNALAHQDVQLVIVHDETGGRAERLAQAVADGVESIGAQALIRSTAANTKHGDAHSHDALWAWPGVTVSDLESSDGVVIVTTPSFGRISSSMARVLDEAIDELRSGEMSGAVGSVFVCRNGEAVGEEGTYLSVIGNLMQLGVVVAGSPNFLQPSGPISDDEIAGPSSPDRDLEEAYRHGAEIAKIAIKLVA